MLKIFWRMAWVCAGLYGVGASLHIVLRWIIPDSPTLIAFINTFAHLLWMPALVLFPIAVMSRRWQWVIVLFLPMVLFIAHYGEAFVPRNPVMASPTVPMIDLLTYNLLGNNRTPQRIPDVITTVDADIVALQEVSVTFGEQIATLEQYPYQAIHSAADHGDDLKRRETMGQAVLSRYPIIEDDYWVYDFLPIPLAHQRVVVDIDGAQVVVYNVHPTHPGMTGASFFSTEFRRREVQDLLDRVTSETLPVIMLGDFNLSDLNVEYDQITAVLTDSYREVGQGMGFTFPDLGEVNARDSISFAPNFVSDFQIIPLMLRLDYVFHSADFKAVSAHVHHTSGGSDHRPLWVRLAIVHPYPK
jgi:endonuclease/exonuclease/phosphatase (EEP) superfamily protein YafD